MIAQSFIPSLFFMIPHRYPAYLQLDSLGMEAEPGGGTALTYKLKSLPILKVPPIIAAIANKIHLPSINNISSSIVKLIILQKAKSIEQILEGAQQLGIKDSFTNKVVLLYVLGLFIIPLKDSNTKREQIDDSLLIQCNFVPVPCKSSTECITFQYQFTCKQQISKQECLSGTWKVIDEYLQRYDITYRWREEGKATELMFNTPIFQGSTELPSAIRLSTSSKGLTLIYPYQRYTEGVQLRHYLDLCRVFKGFWFPTFLDKIVKDLQRILNNMKKDGYYCIEMTFQSIYVVQDDILRIEIDAPMKTNKKQQQNGQQNDVQDPIEASNKLLETKRRIGILLLETIAYWHEKLGFDWQTQKNKEGNQINNFLIKFVEQIQEERLIMKGPILDKIMIWLRLKEGEDQSQTEQIYRKMEEEARKEKNNKDHSDIGKNQYYKLSPIYAKTYNNQQQEFIQMFFSDSMGINNNVNAPSLEKSSIAREINLNVSNDLAYLENIKEKLAPQIARRLSQAEYSKLQDEILASKSFFNSLNFSLGDNSVLFGDCCKCLRSNIIVFFNKCGHGQCRDCLISSIRQGINKGQTKIKCKKDKCPEELTYQLIKTILEKDTAIKQFYCELLVHPFADQHKKKYTYCLKQTCKKLPIIYRSSDKCRILVCWVCKNTTCIFCGKSYHHPKSCRDFQNEQSTILSKVTIIFQEIKWPEFMQMERTVKAREKKLIDAGLLAIKLQEIYLMVKDFLTIHCCETDNNSNDQQNRKKNFLITVSCRIVQLLKRIDYYCESDTQQAEVNCFGCCEEMQRIYQLRTEILLYH